MRSKSVYLIRHGKAEARSPSGSDEDRPLTPRGERQARWLGKSLAALGPGERPDVLLSSGLVRAWATAEALREALGCELRREPLLENSGNNGEVVERALRLAEEGRVPALVGHNPQLEDLAALLTGQTLSLRTGMAVQVDVEMRGRVRRLLRLEEEED